MWAFCWHSLLREYGWQFLWRVALPHPLKTARAVLQSAALDFSGNITSIPADAADQDVTDNHAIVGAGFCLKPIDPPCLSGRSNHDCHYLQHLLHSETATLPVCCRECTIREIGTLALKTGAAFYVMTSAQDILFDVFTPALAERRFTSGLFAICRYSLQPFAVGMLAAGIRGQLFSFRSGDCRDYATWLLADRGTKEERTEIDASDRKTIRQLLARTSSESVSGTQYRKQGNIFYPRDGLQE